MHDIGLHYDAFTIAVLLCMCEVFRLPVLQHIPYGLRVGMICERIKHNHGIFVRRVSLCSGSELQNMIIYSQRHETRFSSVPYRSELPCSIGNSSHLWQASRNPSIATQRLHESHGDQHQLSNTCQHYTVYIVQHNNGKICTFSSRPLALIQNIVLITITTVVRGGMDLFLDTIGCMWNRNIFIPALTTYCADVGCGTESDNHPNFLCIFICMTIVIRVSMHHALQHQAAFQICHSLASS